MLGRVLLLTVVIVTVRSRLVAALDIVFFRLLDAFGLASFGYRFARSPCGLSRRVGVLTLVGAWLVFLHCSES